MVKSHKPIQSSLMNIWYAAVEAEAKARSTPTMDYSKPILAVDLKTHTQARWTRFELYKLRDKARAQSRRGLEPQDPNYGRSMFDQFRLSVHDNQIHIHLEDFTPFDYNIIQTIELPPETPKRFAKKPKPKPSENPS